MHKSLSLEQIRAGRVVADQVRERVKLATSNVEVTAHCRHPGGGGDKLTPVSFLSFKNIKVYQENTPVKYKQKCMLTIFSFLSISHLQIQFDIKQSVGK